MKKETEKVTVKLIASLHIIDIILEEINLFRDRLKKAKAQSFFAGWVSGLSWAIVTAILFVAFR